MRAKLILATLSFLVLPSLALAQAGPPQGRYIVVLKQDAGPPAAVA